MPSPTDRLRALNIELPTPYPPGGNYVHAVRSGNQLFLAGKGYGPLRGKLGRDLTVAEGYDYARSTGTMLLSVIQGALGSLDKVTRIVKVVGMVNATPEFSDHPKVVDGCSDLLVQVFGEAGRHARTSIGVASTPNQIPVEIDMVIEFTETLSPGTG